MAAINKGTTDFLLAALRSSDLDRVKAAVESFHLDLAHDEFPQSLLCAVAQHGDPRIVAYLLESGVDPNKSFNTYTPLCWAVVGSQPENVRLLLAYGADAHVTLSNGTTTLMQAAYSLQGAAEEMAQMLIAQGVDVAALNDKGETAREIALAKRNHGVARLLDAQKVQAAGTRRRRLYARAVPGLL